MDSDTGPAVWVGCVAAYAQGRLHGAWVELPHDDLSARISTILAKSPARAEEWMFSDYRGMPPLGEHASADDLNTMARLIGEFGVGAVFAAWACTGPDVEECADALVDRNEGAWPSWSDFVEDMAETCGVLARVPEDLRDYFDVAAWGRCTLEQGYQYVRHDDLTYVFRNRGPNE